MVILRQAAWDQPADALRFFIQPKSGSHTPLSRFLEGSWPLCLRSKAKRPASETTASNCKCSQPGEENLETSTTCRYALTLIVPNSDQDRLGLSGEDPHLPPTSSFRSAPLIEVVLPPPMLPASPFLLLQPSICHCAPAQLLS